MAISLIIICKLFRPSQSLISILKRISTVSPTNIPVEAGEFEKYIAETNPEPSLKVKRVCFPSDTPEISDTIRLRITKVVKEMQKQTFYVTNSVPQVQDKFNSGIWSSLEGALQTIAKGGTTLYIVTGVAFEKVGESKKVEYIQAKDDTKDIPIPNYFYKLVLKVTTNSSGTVTAAETCGFWFENKAYSDSVYANHAVSVDQVEQWTGFDFFANLPDTIEAAAETNANWSNF